LKGLCWSKKVSFQCVFCIDCVVPTCQQLSNWKTNLFFSFFYYSWSTGFDHDTCMIWQVYCLPSWRPVCFLGWIHHGWRHQGWLLRRGIFCIVACGTFSYGGKIQVMKQFRNDCFWSILIGFQRFTETKYDFCFLVISLNKIRKLTL